MKPPTTQNEDEAVSPSAADRIRAAREADFATAYQRLNEIFSESKEAGDQRTALAAQREINALCGLYAAPAAEAMTATADDAAAARAHLEAMHLAPAGEPLAELARLAVVRILELMSNGATKRR